MKQYLKIRYPYHKIKSSWFLVMVFFWTKQLPELCLIWTKVTQILLASLCGFVFIFRWLIRTDARPMNSSIFFFYKQKAPFAWALFDVRELTVTGQFVFSSQRLSLLIKTRFPFPLFSLPSLVTQMSKTTPYHNGATILLYFTGGMMSSKCH